MHNRLAAGKFFDDAQNGFVLMCGGVACPSKTGVACYNEDACYEWRPHYPQFMNHSTLTRPRFAFMLAEYPNIDEPSNPDPVPIALGEIAMSDIYNPGTGQWSEYQELPSSQWFSTRCFIDYQGAFYFVDENVYKVDPATWNSQLVAPVPQSLVAERPMGKCAGLTIDGDPGIFTPYGYWFNINTKEWHVRAFPPYTTIHALPNAMWSFRGLPTIFGHTKCDDNAVCDNSLVFQYHPHIDEWVQIGTMNSRRSHEVVEVPGDFCDNLQIMTTPGIYSKVSI